MVGLDRTGDQVIGGQFTIQAMMSMLNKMGINLVIDPIQLLTRNIASVMVTAKLPPFVKPGMTLDAVVSSMANAKSLKAGPCSRPVEGSEPAGVCRGPGPVSIGGFLAEQEAQGCDGDEEPSGSRRGSRRRHRGKSGRCGHRYLGYRVGVIAAS